MNKKLIKKRWKKLGKIAGRLPTLNYLAHVIVGIFSISILFIVGVAAALIVGYVLFIFILVFGLVMIFEKVWEWLGHD